MTYAESIAHAENSLAIVYQNLNALSPLPSNARTHSKPHIRKLAESIRIFGFTNPVLVDRLNRIVAGRGRFEAAKKLGIERIPTICLDRLSPEQLRAYVLADNRLAELAGWDKEILAIEFQELMELDQIDITVTGFEMAEIDLIIEEINGNAIAEEPPPEPIWDQEPVSNPGDLWLLGKHKIICGNSLSQSCYRDLLGARRAAMIFTDPPYNVKIDGHATGNGAVRHREFAMASGEMTEAEFLAFLNAVQRQMAALSAENSLHFLCTDWRHISEMLAAGRQNYVEVINICIWDKGVGGMGSMYRSQHEMVVVFRKGKGSHRNNIQLGKFGRNRTNLWRYPGVQAQSRQSDEGNLLRYHPTPKPIAMVSDAILDCTARGEIILDPFLGSGTTLLAAERVGRTCCAIEIDAIYVDTAIRRWQRVTGEAAIHAATKQRFDDIAAQKGGEHA